MTSQIDDNVRVAVPDPAKLCGSSNQILRTSVAGLHHLQVHHQQEDCAADFLLATQGL